MRLNIFPFQRCNN